jgi:hypothetical protein
LEKSPLKERLLLTGLHGVISEKIKLFADEVLHRTAQERTLEREKGIDQCAIHITKKVR